MLRQLPMKVCMLDGQASPMLDVLSAPGARCVVWGGQGINMLQQTPLLFGHPDPASAEMPEQSCNVMIIVMKYGVKRAMKAGV